MAYARLLDSYSRVGGLLSSGGDFLWLLPSPKGCCIGPNRRFALRVNVEPHIRTQIFAMIRLLDGKLHSSLTRNAEAAFVSRSTRNVRLLPNQQGLESRHCSSLPESLCKCNVFEQHENLS